MIDSFIEIELKDDGDFLKIAETLTRIGIADKDDCTLTQICHILHKRKKYYIVHYKEMFLLDGVFTNIDEIDLARRNTIANLLDDWNLLTIINPEVICDPYFDRNQVHVIPFRDKEKWNLEANYIIGNK